LANPISQITNLLNAAKPGGASAPSGEPLAPGNDLAQSKYNFKYKVFPNDLGMDDNGHYMIININVPTTGQKVNGLQLGTPAGAFTNQFQETNQVSKVDTLRYGSTTVGGSSRPAIAIPRNTRRIEESIALYMPSQMIWNQHNIYQEISLTAVAGRLGIGIVSAASAAVSAFAGSVGAALAGSSASILDSIGNQVGNISKLTQSPINPAVEVLFSNTDQRQFTFELLLAPRNEKESETIKEIVRTLRFHAAPEINPNYGGFMWIPPADFDITFFNKGYENRNILRINTCILERIEVDYAPSGVYATFRNGHPVAVRINMGFRELEPIHKQRILMGF